MKHTLSIALLLFTHLAFTSVSFAAGEKVRYGNAASMRAQRVKRAVITPHTRETHVSLQPAERARLRLSILHMLQMTEPAKLESQVTARAALFFGKVAPNEKAAAFRDVLAHGEQAVHTGSAPSGPVDIELDAHHAHALTVFDFIMVRNGRFDEPGDHTPNDAVRLLLKNVE